MQFWKLRTLALALVLVPATAFAAPACDVPNGWTKPVAHRAATSADMRFALKPGETVALTLVPDAKVKLAASSAHKPKPGPRFAGLAAIDLARARAVTIVLSDKAYVDLVREGKVLTSTAHSDASCGGIAKSVSFTVTPGRYIVQFTDAPAAALKMAVIGG